jgi:hypothetical protein
MFGCFCLASESEVACFSAHGTAGPPLHGLTWKHPVSKPGRIELNLDLFEANRGGCVAMARAGAIEDRGWAGDELPPNLSLIQIGADHKKRKNGPVMCVLWHAAVAPVDNPSDTDSAEAPQHHILRQSTTMTWLPNK